MKSEKSLFGISVKMCVLTLLLVSQMVGFFSTKEPKITSDDLQVLTGSQWVGTLTYLDYRSNKKVSIRTNLTVRPNGADKWSWVFEYTYPDEPKANNEEIVRLSKDGKTLNGEVVMERTGLPDGTVRLVTEKKGEDNRRGASIRFTYLLNSKSFSIKKEVRYDDENEFFARNEYSWKR